MRLHSLRLENFRGVTERELEFPERGVVIVQGPNEVGKTSMMEGLDLLLHEKDSTRKQSVRDVQPVGRDVGVSVSAEISAGPYRFKYSKRWLKAPATELQVTKPRRESHVGVEAHDRVMEILHEAVDLDLFAALRVLQGQRVDTQIEVQGNAALRAALESASGTAVSDDEGAENLVQAIEAEYLKFFTRGGRPTGEYRDCVEELSEANEAVHAAKGRVAEIEDQVAKFALLEDDLARLIKNESEAQKNLAEHTARFEALDEHRTAVDEAQAVLQVAQQFLATASKEHAERESLLKEQAERAKDAAAAKQAHRVATAKVESARKLFNAVVAELAAAEEAFANARLRTSEMEKTVAAADKHAEWKREAKRLSRLNEAQERLAKAQAALAEHRVDDKVLEQIRSADKSVQMAQAQLDAAAAQVAVSVKSMEEITVNGENLTVDPSAPAYLSVTSQLALQIGDNVSLAITPATGADERIRAHRVAVEALEELLDAAGVADLAAAIDANTIYRENARLEDSATSEITALLGADSQAELETRVAVLEKQLDGQDAPLAQETAREELDAQVLQAREQRDAAEHAASEKRREKEERESELTRTRVAAAGSQSELAAAQNEFERSEAAVVDAEKVKPVAQLLADLEAAQSQCDAAEAKLVSAQERLSSHNPNAVTAQFENAVDVVKRNEEEIRSVTSELDQLTGALKNMGAEGRHEEVDTARTAQEVAQRKHDRLMRQAQAARLLHETVQRYQQETWQRYVAPFQETITALGRLVFGPDVHFEVSPNLEIMNRTHGDETVDFEHLSTGAQEQVGILSRLACAQLVSYGGGVPVLIDDALGNSDPKRLEGLGAVLNRAGRDAQVIVLTCTPERYADVGAATVIRL